MSLDHERLIWADALRGLAILLMVQDHAFDWWLRGEFHVTLWGRVTEFLGTLAAPLFLFLMGMALALSAEKRLRWHPRAYQVAISMARRGVFLVLQGYLLTFLTFYDGQNLQEMAAVDILHCLGLSMIGLIPLTLARRWSLSLVCTLVVSTTSAWAGSWKLAPLVAPWINNAAGISYFPLFPFVAYALAGLTFGQLYARHYTSALSMRRLKQSVAFSACGLFLLLPVIPAELGSRFPRPIFLAFSLGVILWLLLLFGALDRRRALLGPLASAGQTAMMLYVVHHMIGYRLFYMVGWVTGHSWEGQYGVFYPTAATALLFALLLLLYGLTHVWLTLRPRIGAASLVRRYAHELEPYW